MVGRPFTGKPTVGVAGGPAPDRARDLRKMRDQRRLAAIVSADMVGYSLLMGRNDSATVAGLKAHRQELIDPKIEEYGGRIVKTTGDGLLLEFPSVVNAVRCAVELQRGMAERNANVAPASQLQFRIGINVGDIIVDGDDIFGDGVNVAARLQEIARPGGICLSNRVQEEIRDRTQIDLDDGGERTLKNIERPIRVWQWAPPSRGVATDPLVSPVSVGPPFALPVKPSIAVLPFANMSGDEEQQYFADGIAEDITTELSRFHELFVIARNSTFAFRGRAVDIKDVAGKLGVKYVLEGSVRRIGNRVRITSQLIDGATGNHVWAERFDRDLSDIFAVQDEITEAIVTAIAPRVTELERDRARRSPGNISAWENYHRALWHAFRYNADDNAIALDLFAHAIDVDPEFARAHAGYAYSLIIGVTWGFARDRDADIERAMNSARIAVALDNRDAFSRVALSRALMFKDDLKGALGEGEAAVRLNPNFALAHNALGFAQHLAGCNDDALASLNKAIRLSPFDPLLHAFFVIKTGILIVMGRYQDALELIRKAQHLPNCSVWVFMFEASALANLGFIDEAKVAMAKARSMDSNISMKWVRRVARFSPEVNAVAYFDGLVLAGLPD